EEEEMQRKPPPPAMDQAAVQKLIDDNRKSERARFAGVREAERVVRPWIGDIAIAQDSAEAVYKLALDSLGKNVDGVHPSAYRAILEMLPKPGEATERQFVAMDAAQSKDFSERYPGAGSLKRI